MVSLIRMFTVDEGCKQYSYKDTRGNVTVGFGFNMDDASSRAQWGKADVHENFDLVYNKSVPISMESAWSLLTVCIKNCEDELRSILHDYESMPQDVQYALINLIFNLGMHKFLTFDTFLNRIRVNNFEGAAKDLEGTLWYKEVPNRAKRVCSLLRGDDSGYAA